MVRTPTQDDPDNGSPRAPVSVLVVDDEKHLAAMFRHALAERGFRCHAVTSAHDALVNLRAEHYDVLVSDICMPGMDGIELMKTIRAEQPELGVLFITGGSTVTTAVEAMKAGAHDLITKPFDLAVLGQKVRALAKGLKQAGESSTSHLRLEIAGVAELPGYRLDRKIGEGAMGTVFLAHQISLDRKVAIKVIGTGAFASEQARVRFAREARAAAKMAHVNIIHIYALVEHASKEYLVMEYFPSRTLRQVVDRVGYIDAKQAVFLTLQMAGALTHAARKGIVHRDMKPGNILIGKKWQAKLTDFGLAKETTIVGTPQDADGTGTRVGTIVGSPAYMSPEQAATRLDIDVRSDIYSLGLCLYFMLQGRDPFRGTVHDMIRAHLAAPLPEIRTQSLPARLQQILARMTAKDLAQRYQDGESLFADLTALHRAL